MLCGIIGKGEYTFCVQQVILWVDFISKNAKDRSLETCQSLLLVTWLFLRITNKSIPRYVASSNTHQHTVHNYYSPVYGVYPSQHRDRGKKL